MGQAAQLAPAGNPVHYERRRPEETTLYQLVQGINVIIPAFTNEELFIFFTIGDRKNYK